MSRRLDVGLHAAIVAVTDDEPRVLTVPSPAGPALPYGPLDPDADRTLELGLRRWVGEQTGSELGYVEQLYTFGDRDRDPVREDRRVLSVGYLALVREPATSPEGVKWSGVYAFLPWEDWRGGRPAALDTLVRGVESWLQREDGLGKARLRERAAIAFGLEGTPWDAYRVLERYELLYEAGLVSERTRDRGEAGEGAPAGAGRAMALDHRRIVATALGRVRGKLKYRPVVFELLAETFTLLQLQRVVEALAGQRLHKQNFRRLVERAGLVEGTGRLDRETGGRPAELFRFRREVLLERPSPGVGLPAPRA